VLELKDISSFTDYFVICSGESTTQVRAIAEHIEESLLKDPKKIKPFGIEGLQASKWVLMDYSDVVVHIFEKETRDFYALEMLWLDAKRIELPQT
jgi:ribosome-associated protein